MQLKFTKSSQSYELQWSWPVVYNSSFKFTLTSEEGVCLLSGTLSKLLTSHHNFPVSPLTKLPPPPEMSKPLFLFLAGAGKNSSIPHAWPDCLCDRRMTTRRTLLSPSKSTQWSTTVGGNECHRSGRWCTDCAAYSAACSQKPPMGNVTKGILLTIFRHKVLPEKEGSNPATSGLLLGKQIPPGRFFCTWGTFSEKLPTCKHHNPSTFCASRKLLDSVCS